MARPDRYWQCARKKRYNNRTKAKKARGQFIKHEDDPTIAVYYCHICGGWHLGHPSWSKQK